MRRDAVVLGTPLGIAAGTVYLYFKTKSDLLVQASKEGIGWPRPWRTRSISMNGCMNASSAKSRRILVCSASASEAPSAVFQAFAAS